MTSEQVVEIGGERFVLLRRPAPEGGPDQFSLDGGESWSPRVVDAYSDAQASGKLVRYLGEVEEQDNEFETWLVRLAQEVGALKPGESLKIVRDERAIMVTRETALFACRASAVRDVDLSVGEEDRRGPGG